MIHLIGSGGHCKVVIEALLASGVSAATLIIRDGNSARQGQHLMGVEIACPEIDHTVAGDHVHVAIGDCATRARFYEAAATIECRPYSVIHPSAMISPSAEIGEGSLVAAGAIIGPLARIGKGCIINHGAIIDHDCHVGDYCHIAPNATLGGGVVIGDAVLVGSGATILPMVSVGSKAVVGAGTIITRAVPSGQIWFGNPAKKQA